LQTQPAPNAEAARGPAGEIRPLKGRHAVVTGASRGIGWAIAEELARLGADLTLTARDAAALAARCDDLSRRFAVRARGLAADVTDDGAVRAALTQAAEAFGAPAILVNNAGAARSAPFGRIDDAHWDEMLAVNLTGVFRWARAALPAMRAAGWGRIVNVASIAGLTGYPYVVAYCAAKHGVVGLTRALARELAQTGITVNAVCPGYTDTDMVAEAVRNIVAKTGRSAAEARAELVRGNPQGRLVRPEEVAATVGFLCLPEAAAITGQAIAVAGGEVMP
jgi:NAD(P)-dependent dehydrogenase (short-subunit alcohol dehydrogenase family)